MKKLIEAIVLLLCLPSLAFVAALGGVVHALLSVAR